MTDGVKSVRVWVPVICAALVFGIVAAAGVWITAEPRITAAELVVLEGFDLRHTPQADALALMINDGFGPVGAVIVGIVAAVLAGLTLMSWRAGVTFAILIAVPWLAVTLVKIIVERPRPDAGALLNVLVTTPTSTSFPSGHTAFAAALGCAVIFTIARHVRGRVTLVAVILAAIALAVVTAWSRMYLGVHQPTDVAASIVLVPVVSWATAAVIGRISARSSAIAE